MLDRIIRFSLQNRPLIIAGAILLLIGGIYTTLNIDVDVFPPQCAYCRSDDRGNGHGSGRG